MPRAPHLDNNEKAFLTVYAAEGTENWICPWALGEQKLEAAGADMIGRSFTGAMQVARRLSTRKLLDNDGVRGQERGYCINDKGKAALEAQPQEA